MPRITRQEAAQELLRRRAARRDPVAFLNTYGHISDVELRDWMAFHLWPEQERTLRILDANQLVCILKARQLGLTWLALGYVLWLILFRPAATVLLFSRRDDEATDLLTTRLRGMYDRLPPWCKWDAERPGRRHPFVVDNDHEWELANGSRVLAFPTTAGDSYTATFALVDEADLVPDLDRLMRAVKPTIDAGGRMVLLSRSDKTRPQSPFKRIYAGAKQGHTSWVPVFLPWYLRPGRDAAWYEAQKAEILHRTRALDELHEQYPATDVEALAPRVLDKRIAPEWLEQCYREQTPLPHLPPGCPSIPGLEVYVLPQPRRTYVLGADPAEGNPTSDDSALTVLDSLTGEEVATLAGRLQPAVLAAHADRLGQWYNRAGLLVERNNHGHAVLLWLKDHSHLRRLCGPDGKEGWLSSSRGKVLLYDACADTFRERGTVLHSFATFVQLASIEGSSLRAPEGEHDDRAVGYALACAARLTRRPPGSPAAGGERPELFPQRENWRPPGGTFR
jgi:hypothetical protein